MTVNVNLTSLTGDEIDPFDANANDARQSFCNASYEALQRIAPAHGYKVEDQVISHELDEVFAFADVNFAMNKPFSWVEWFYVPLAVARLVETVPIVEMRFLATRSYSGNGEDDAGITPEENAERTIGFMDGLAKKAPSPKGFVDFLREGRHPQQYREIEVLSLFSEGRVAEAKQLCADILSGEVQYSSLYRVLPSPDGTITETSEVGLFFRGGNMGAPPEGSVTFIHVISDWLDRQD